MNEELQTQNIEENNQAVQPVSVDNTPVESTPAPVESNETNAAEQPVEGQENNNRSTGNEFEIDEDPVQMEVRTFEEEERPQIINTNNSVTQEKAKQELPTEQSGNITF